jgi:NAD(P)H-dependent flavin oxidoreductase YrpB (nitropropane dioxygenase family)
MISTRFTELVGCAAPVQQAPNGEMATMAALPIAVARAGGHGMLAAPTTPAAEPEPVLEELAAEAGRAWGVNVIVPMTPPETVELAGRRAPLVDFHQGDPDPERVELVHRGGGAPPDVPLQTRVLRSGLERDRPFLAGESTGVVQGVQPAAEIVRELAEGAEELLARAARLVAPAVA